MAQLTLQTPPGHSSHYLAEERHQEIENPLIKAGLVGRIIPESEVVQVHILCGFAETANANIARVSRQNGVKEHIQFVFIDSEVPNAIALAQGSDINCICISTAFFTNLITSFSNLAASPYFQRIWSGQIVQPIPGPFHRSRREALRWVFFEGPLNPPNDMGFALSQIAFNFIVLHELGHIINGHLRSGVLNGMSITEHLTEPEKDLLLTRRTLEMDADCFAIQECINLCYIIAERGSDHWIGRLYVKDFETAFLTLSACVTTIICSFDANYSGRAGRFAHRSHPPAYIRQWICGAAAMTVCEKRVALGNGPAPIDFENLWSSGAAGVHLAISDLGRCAFDRKEHKKWHRAVKVHDTANLKRWAKLRPILEQAKFGTHSLAKAQFTTTGQRIEMTKGKYWTGQ